MHLALDGDIRISHAGRKQLTSRAQEESQSGRHLPPLLDGILHLLEEGILQDGVDNQHQGRDDTGEQSLGALILEESQKGADGAGLLGGGSTGQSLILAFGGSGLACGHARVDDPDGVGQNDGGGAGDGAGDHRLNGRELLGGPTGLDGGRLKEGARPFVPVVVDEVGDGDAEQGGGKTGVEAADALAGDNLLDGGEEGGIGRALGFDLGAGGEGDEGVAVVVWVVSGGLEEWARGRDGES